MIKRTQASQINHNTAFNLLFQLHANATIELSMSHTNFLLFSTRFFFTFCKANGELPLSSYTYVTCWHLLLLILLILHPLCCYYIYYNYCSVCVSARAPEKLFICFSILCSVHLVVRAAPVNTMQYSWLILLSHSKHAYTPHTFPYKESLH